MNAEQRKRIRFFLLYGVLVAGIFLLAGGIPNLRLQPGKPLNLLNWLLSQLEPEESLRPVNLPSFVPLGEGMLTTLISVFWLMLIFSILYALVSPKFRKRLIRLLLFVFLMMILLPQVLENFARQRGGENDAGGGFPLGESALPTPPAFVQQPPEWLFVVVNVLLLIFFVVVIYFLWQRFRPIPTAQAVITYEVRQAITRLEAGGNFKDVVIACYVKMCQGLEANHRVKRKQTMTPREFEHSLADAGIADHHIRQLTRLFERARYGAKRADKATEREATQCLQAILQAYGDNGP